MHSSSRAIFDEIFSQNIIHKIVDATNKYGKNLFKGKRQEENHRKLNSSKPMKKN